MRALASSPFLLLVGLTAACAPAPDAADGAVAPDLSEVEADADTGAPVEDHGESRSCGVQIDEATIDAIEAFHKPDLLDGALEGSEFGRAGVFVTIDVWAHVIERNGNSPVTTQQLNDQIAVLNQAYAGMGLGFRLAGTDRTSNSSWYTGCASGSERAMKNALHTGGSRDLNLYFCEPSFGILGFSSLPWDYSRDPSMDGVVLLDSTLPGGSAWGYNLGDTAVHEIGHWLGLYHTFEGGCRAPGDRVGDTPPEGSAASSCNLRRNTCAGGGNDPVDNFMDYTDDSCMDHFTPGQIRRMQQMSALYR